jgi:DNA-binding PadR family transcriptional regulator
MGAALVRPQRLQTDGSMTERRRTEQSISTVVCRTAAIDEDQGIERLRSKELELRASSEPTQPDSANWDERGLLLLGVLMMQDQHGYQINEFIERSLCRVTSMKKPTAYALLDRLAAGGYISVYREQAGSRPQRKVYSITPSGQKLFYELLRTNLADVSKATDEGDIGLMMLDYLDRASAIAALRERLNRIDALIDDAVTVPPHGGKLSVKLALDHLLAIRRADRDWLAATIDRLERDETEPPSVD